MTGGSWVGWGKCWGEDDRSPKGHGFSHACFGPFWSFWWNLDGKRMFHVRAAHMPVSSSPESVDAFPVH